MMVVEGVDLFHAHNRVAAAVYSHSFG